MEILSVAGNPYEDYEGQVLELHVRLEDDEVIHVSEKRFVKMRDDFFVDTEVRIINPKLVGDFAWVSQKGASRVGAGEYGISENEPS